jgi:asparagine synthase (glutamine-hydrolysing)
MYSEAYAEQMGARDPYKGLLDSIDIPRQLTGRAPVNQALYLWGKSVLPGYILTTLGDRMEMAHSIEGRLPFLDHKVVEQIVAMPVRLKIRGMTEKYVLREATRSVITDTVYKRQKHPFLSPPATLNLDDRLHQMMQDNLRGPLLKAMPFFDQKKVVKVLDGLSAMDDGEKTVIDQVLTLMLSACALQERYSLSA